MSSSTSSENQRWLELLAGNAIGDLSPEEEMELNRLEPKETARERHEFECVAAALAIALTGNEHESMPADLRSKIQEALESQITGASQSSTVSPLAKRGDIAISDRLGPRTNASGFKSRELFAWLCMAASLMVAAGLWFSRTQTSTTLVANSERRTTLIEKATDLIQVNWTEGKTPFESPVTGDVTWSTAKQEGYMRFAGMPRNDPTIQQYQLWIIDPARDDEPIDGGVFDIRSAEEHIVPITAKLAVLSPKAFAITIEKPGGVVVSTQARLPLLAAVP